MIIGRNHTETHRRLFKIGRCERLVRIKWLARVRVPFPTSRAQWPFCGFFPQVYSRFRSYHWEAIMFTLEKFTTADSPLFHTLVTNEPAMRMNLGRPLTKAEASNSLKRSNGKTPRAACSDTTKSFHSLKALRRFSEWACSNRTTTIKRSKWSTCCFRNTGTEDTEPRSCAR